MKRIIALILLIVCTLSFTLVGCQKQEVEPVTVSELLDLIESEGYTDIQHKDNSCDYFLLDSGDSQNKDENDIYISLNTINTNNLNDNLTHVFLGCNSFNDEFENLSTNIFYKITNDKEFVDDVMLLSKNEEIVNKHKGDISFYKWYSSDDFLERTKTDYPNAKRYELEIIILGTED